MSSLCKRIAKNSSLHKTTKQKVRALFGSREPVVKHKSFNIFSDDGRNYTVTAPYPMTLEEAQHYYNALCIGAND